MTLNEPLSEALTADLAAFADPGTRIVVSGAVDGWTTVAWKQAGRERRSQFSLEGGLDLADIRVREGAASGAVSYATFLASSHMGDLIGLARNTLNVVQPVDYYVVPGAVAESAAGETVSGGADELVSDLTGAPQEETIVVFLTADAGVGKTSLLAHLVREKAAAYLRGDGEALWLYVNAQGSRLARLDQAIAATLDDLRASFPYHAASALVRSGALVLVVDGFDELIGTQGTYDEAFSSLASFIETLRGRGVLVAAARSAYYEQEFATRADTTIGFETDRWALSPVTLSPWSPEQRTRFISMAAADSDADPVALATRVEAVFDDPGLADLGSTPLFVSRVSKLLLEGANLAPGGDLAERLITTYLSREAHEKWLSPQGGPVLSVDQMRDFFSEIANEMWRQETRELSNTSLRELVGLVADLFELDDEGRMVVIERTPYSAVMAAGSTPGSVAFGHELYFSYFLAAPVIDACRTLNGYRIASALRRGRLPKQAGELAGRGLRDAVASQALVSALADAADDVSLGADQVRQNGGLIVSGLIVGNEVSDLSIARLQFVDCDLSASTMEHVRFTQCEFHGVNLVDAVLRQCSFQGALFDGVIVNYNTRLDIDAPADAFLSLVVLDNGTRRTVYSPADRNRVLGDLGFPVAEEKVHYRQVDQDAVAVVEGLVRIYERTNLATLQDDGTMKRLISRPRWDDVYESLRDAGVIAEEVRSARGNSRLFVRLLVRARELLAGELVGADVDERVTRFWTLLEQRASAPPEGV